MICVYRFYGITVPSVPACVCLDSNVSSCNLESNQAFDSLSFVRNSSKFNRSKICVYIVTLAAAVFIKRILLLYRVNS